MLDVTTVETSHGDTPILGHVNMRLFSQNLGLGGGQTSETGDRNQNLAPTSNLSEILPEHSNLALDVSPLSGSLEIVSKHVVQLLSHADDPISHALDLTLPLRVESTVAQDRVCDPGSVHRRIRVHGTNDNLQLTVHACFLLSITGRQREFTDTLSVQTHVLGERLGEGNLVALRDEVTDGKGVAGCRARGEALVRHVEEREEFLLLHEVRDLNPLFGGGVNAGGVLRASVQQHDCSFGSRLIRIG